MEQRPKHDLHGGFLPARVELKICGQAKPAARGHESCAFDDSVSDLTDMSYQSALQQVCSWYHANCDGDWEHEFGICIETIDNPGWRLRIDLTRTALMSKPFDRVESEYDDASNWLRCWRTDTHFEAACGLLRLEDALTHFMAWARDQTAL
jgi:hypothetical protein